MVFFVVHAVLGWAPAPRWSMVGRSPR